MQKKILTLLLCSALSVCAFSGCEDAKAEPEESGISTVALEEGKFDKFWSIDLLWTKESHHESWCFSKKILSSLQDCTSRWSGSRDLY